MYAPEFERLFSHTKLFQQRVSNVKLVLSITHDRKTQEIDRIKAGADHLPRESHELSVAGFKLLKSADKIKGLVDVLSSLKSNDWEVVRLEREMDASLFDAVINRRPENTSDARRIIEGSARGDAGQVTAREPLKLRSQHFPTLGMIHDQKQQNS